jgi:hypothetical protein
MAMDYPDIMSEYLVATERYETDGVQIAPQLEPDALEIGEVANLILFLQSALDVPVELTFKPELPQTSRFRGSPVLALGKPEFRVALEAGQVGILSVPLTTTASAKEGQHTLQLNVSGQAPTQAQPTRIRPPETAGRFRSDLIDDVLGLDLVRVVGVPYKTRPTHKISVPVTLRGRAESPEEAPDLATHFQPVWSQEDLRRQSHALQEVSQRRATIAEQLQTEPLFVALFVEGQKRFAEAGVRLRVGEAIALGKVLTYTVQHFMADVDRQDGLLIPIWELATEYNLSTADPLWLVRHVGFRHLLRLSVALSFGVIRQALGRHPWSLEERRAVITMIGNTVEASQTLPPEFVYIPLLLAAPLLSGQVSLEDEDNQHSLSLLQMAKAQRADVFADPDLADANAIFENTLKAAMQA